MSERLRAVLCKTGHSLRDFSNTLHDVVIVGYPLDKVGPFNARPTHQLRLGWRYRLDLVTTVGLPVVRLTGMHPQLAPGGVTRDFPADCFKELDPWLLEDQKLEDAERAASDMLATAKPAAKKAA